MSTATKTAAILFLSFFLWAGLASGQAPRKTPVALLASVSVPGDLVTLADLLPPSADVSLRRRAGDIVIALAPQPPSRRILAPDDVSRAPRMTPQLLSRITIPERITITRAAREITREEICDAVRRVLAKNGFAQAPGLLPAQIVPAVPVLITVDDPRLEVLRMHLGNESESAQFELWTSAEPTVRPFEVAVRDFPALTNWIKSHDASPPAAPALLVAAKLHVAGRNDSSQTDKSTPSLFPERPTQRRTNWLVVPGNTAALLLQSPNMRVHTLAVPLENGALGQRIRVRNLSTGAVLEAQVVGPGNLAASF